jgi:hypothetical protein
MGTGDSRFGNIADVSTMPKEQLAVIKYQREDDAKKAFECKEILFNQTKIELHLAGKIHSFAEDIKKEAELRKLRDEVKKEQKALSEAKRLIQQNLTNQLSVHLELKQLITDEATKALLKSSLDAVKAKLHEAKDASNLEALAKFKGEEESTLLHVSRKDGQKVDLKSLNDALKVAARDPVVRQDREAQHGR